jgi:hypothetical protein
MQTIKIGTVHYNAKSGAFEARVDIARNNRTFRYPCALTGPASMDAPQVIAGLQRQALRMSDTPMN